MCWVDGNCVWLNYIGWLNNFLMLMFGVFCLTRDSSIKIASTSEFCNKLMLLMVKILDLLIMVMLCFLIFLLSGLFMRLVVMFKLILNVFKFRLLMSSKSMGKFSFNMCFIFLYVCILIKYFMFSECVILMKYFKFWLGKIVVINKIASASYLRAR